MLFKGRRSDYLTPRGGGCTGKAGKRGTRPGCRAGNPGGVVGGIVAIKEGGPGLYATEASRWGVGVEESPRNVSSLGGESRTTKAH